MTLQVYDKLMIPNVVDRLRVERGDYILTSGDRECTCFHANAAGCGFTCGILYREHPTVPGFPRLRRRCDGKLVEIEIEEGSP